jgi:CubicO group peptidase (beta-lactamase class C family)
MKAFHLLLLVFSLSIAYFAKAQVQTSYKSEAPLSAVVQQKIQAVEQSLAGWVHLEGTRKWTIEQRMKQHNVKGVSIALIKDYQIEWVKAYGIADEAEQRPVTPETRFQAGSISKSLNGVGLLTLVQSGKVDLFRDINHYLTSWKFPYDSTAKGKTISLANLLSHTAGLSVHGFPGYAVN